MQTKENKEVTFSRPKDQSLKAYKVWISEIAKRLTTQNTMLKLTEDEWRKSWKEYWQQKFRR
ncbi:MAG TPA: hypothetical protein VF918_01995 [Anaerolineales bacterium]